MTASDEVVESKGTRRCLLVDDCRFDRRRIVSLAARSDHDLIFEESANLEDARRRLKSESFDLVFLDIRMPGGTGLELCREIQNDPTLQGIPIIFMSGQVDHATAMREIEAGGRDYLNKDRLDRSTVERVLKDYLETPPDPVEDPSIEDRAAIDRLLRTAAEDWSADLSTPLARISRLARDLSLAQPSDPRAAQILELAESMTNYIEDIRRRPT